MLRQKRTMGNNKPLQKAHGDEPGLRVEGEKNNQHRPMVA